MREIETDVCPFRTVRATTVGSGIAKILSNEQLVGKVEAIFDRVINISLEAKQLFILAKNDVQKSPITILMDIPPSNSIYAFGVRPGLGVIKSASYIRICESTLLVDLENAIVWEAQKQIDVGLPKKRIMDNCNIAKYVGLKCEKYTGLFDLLVNLNVLTERQPIEKCSLNYYSKTAFSYVAKLLEAVPSRNLDDIDSAVIRLIGLGVGLTPSCDDMLMGFMSSLLLLTEALNGDTHYVEGINKTIASRANGRTTLLSEKLLEHAAIGEVPEFVFDVIKAICSGNEGIVRMATLKLADMGHSSGIDALLGILLGINVGMKMSYIRRY